MSIEEDNSMTSARVNSIDEAPEREETAHENAEKRESAHENAEREENASENSESSSLVHTTETKFLPKAHEFETESASKLEFGDILNEDLHRPSEQKAGNMGDKEISSNRRTSDTADQNEAYKLDSKERLLNVASRCVAVTTCIDRCRSYSTNRRSFPQLRRHFNRCCNRESS
ncbi:hypothetical protein O6P43_004666 [Quillaja saponaria]|uniref:Uncharacterized protein n=1 Tax=Quillaja saponaria TaxID=32244 RepID=A0AAD7Q4C2_QUISA|nr:hypothetical protein O6P43_004666 [Quillaja saponaria]